MVNREVISKFTIDEFHTAFRFNYNEDFVFRGEAHDFWEINYLKDGRIIMTQDDTVYEMEAGDIIFHQPMAFHREQSAEGSSPSGYTISFHTVGSLPVELTHGVFRLTDAERDELEGIADKLIPFVNDALGDEFEGQLLSCLLSAFCIRLARARASAPSLTSRSAMQYRDAISRMRDAVYENCTMSEIADACKISTSYLKLLFSTYAGVSPKAYYSALRANEAARLLREGASAAEVSDRMKFSSANYFSFFMKIKFSSFELRIC